MVRVSYSIVYVSDMSRSVGFYRDVLGLPLKFESPGWTEFGTEGTTLALHKSDGPDPHAHEKQAHPAGRCVPGLEVPNLEEFHKRMVGKGVPCLRQPGEVFGAKIAQYADPDGLPIAVGEERRSG